MLVQIRRKVFFSFHYANDAWRTSMVRNIGVIEGQKPFSDNKWEEVKKKGDSAIKAWIDDNMKGRSCVVVLIGSETYDRKYVKYEINRAWTEGKGVVGIYIHGLKDRDGLTATKGKNPFEQFWVDKTMNYISERNEPMDDNEIRMSKVCTAYLPKGKNSKDFYADIECNITNLIEEAICIRQQYPM